MRVVTTCSKAGLKEYGHRWLESRKNWPEGTDFQFYTEGFEVDCPGKDINGIEDFAQWKLKHAHYQPGGWQWDVVKFAHKIFAAADAFMDYDGIGVWLDADCVTYKPIPEGLIESQVKDHYLACYQRTGMYTETGLWIVDCKRPDNHNFMQALRGVYLTDRFTNLPQWHDCFVLDAVIRSLGVSVNNLSGQFHKAMHPQAMSELGKYVDHCKGPRKIRGRSDENKHREVA